MITWEETSAGLRVVDRAKTELVIEARGWNRGGDRREIPNPVDKTVTGTVAQLRFPPGFATLTDVTTGESTELGNRTSTHDLGEGAFLLYVYSGVMAYVRFDGPATVEKTDDHDALVLSFARPAAVTLGFRSTVSVPQATVTVPETPAGLATALSHMSSALRTTDPNRSFPTMRRHPPLLEFGEEYVVPETVREATPETGIELRLPPTLDALFVAAPLAYYLGASVAVGDVAPHVDVSPVDRRVPLGARALQQDVADLLVRTFWLDALVRNIGPHGTDLAEFELLDAVGIDAAEVYDGTPAERFAAYVDAPFERIAGDLPEWHLAMHVAPSMEHARSLPFLLDRLSLIYLPETTALESRELMSLSLDDFYRFSPGDTPDIELRKPRLQRGRCHGWLAGDTPINVFQALPEAFTNRLDYLDRSTDERSVTVVLNDDGMGSEREAVADIYRKRAADLPLDVSLRAGLSRKELAAVFAEENDFVHYIGHCDADGLRCTDGNLAVSELEESNTQTFFLNACGSYYEGLELVRKGSVAGAVTFREVLDKQAAKVGTAFARLLVNGFSIEQSLRLARRRIMMGTDYAVVGDGTHVLMQSENATPMQATVTRSGEEFELEVEAFLARTTGGYYQPYVHENDRSYLWGNESRFVLDRKELVSFLERAEMSTLYDGDLYWSTDLAAELR